MKTSVSGCTACGGAFRVAAEPLADPALRLRCPHCGYAIPGRVDLDASRTRTTVFALSALLLYPPAVLLPVMRIDRLGHAHETSILEGVATLAVDGHPSLAVVVLICSVVVPLAKLLGLLVLAGRRPSIPPRLRRRAWRVLEAIGRWGMLDVLLVAALVALVKLGDLVRIDPGPGAAVFSAMVVFSLLASASFDSRILLPETRR